MPGGAHDHNTTYTSFRLCVVYLFEYNMSDITDSTTSATSRQIDYEVPGYIFDNFSNVVLCPLIR